MQKLQESCKTTDLLLADGSTATAGKRTINCHTDTYEDIRLDVFVQYCFPKKWPWAKFFVRPDVNKAIASVADELESQADKSIHIEPPIQKVFKALEMVGPDKIKVVIVGQDPTPQKGKATGMAFSVDDPRTVPSVMNVLMEVALEGWSVDLSNGDLSEWARQGVLLLNSALTIGKKAKFVYDHSVDWLPFTKLLIKQVASPCVWIVWGEEAQGVVVPLIGKKRNHYIIQGAHPSPNPYIGYFFGHDYFSCANKFLEKKVGEHAQIDWGLAPLRDERLQVQSIGFYPCPKFF